MERTHWGQHEPDPITGERCFGCHLQTISYQDGTPAQHAVKGNPWVGNPVAERITELTGVEIDTDVPRAPGADRQTATRHAVQRPASTPLGRAAPEPGIIRQQAGHGEYAPRQQP